MRRCKKSWLLLAIALISVVTAFFVWRSWRPNRVKRQSAAITAGKPQLIVETGHSDSVSSVAFSPDGKMLASGSDDNAIKLWEVATGTEIRSLKGLHPRANVTFSPDGKMLASWEWNDGMVLWDIATGAKILSIAGHSSFSTTLDSEGRVVREGGYIESVAFSPDGKVVATGSHDRTIKFWEIATGEKIRTLKEDTVYITSKRRTDYITSITFNPEVVFSPDGKILACNDVGGVIRLWDVATGTVIRSLEGHTNNVTSLSISPDGKMLASGSQDSKDGKGTIKLWDVATGTVICSLNGYAQSVTSYGYINYVALVAFSPDCKTLISGDADGLIKLWDVATHIEIRSFTGNGSSIALSPDGKTLAIGGGDFGIGGIIRLWDVASGTQIRRQNAKIITGQEA